MTELRDSSAIGCNSAPSAFLKTNRSSNLYRVELGDLLVAVATVFSIVNPTKLAAPVPNEPGSASLT